MPSKFPSVQLAVAVLVHLLALEQAHLREGQVCRRESTRAHTISA